MPLPDIRRICVVLVSTRNPLNIGASARAMSNFGIRNLRLVKPYEPGFREARSAVGAAATLEHARIFSTLADAVADCALVIGTTGGRDRHLNNSLLRLQDAAPLVEQETARGMVAIVFGSEKRGLSNDDLSYCHWTMHIPTAEDHVSMNLGQAVAVSLYEIMRTPPLAHTHVTPSADSSVISDTQDSNAQSDRVSTLVYQPGVQPPQESQPLIPMPLNSTPVNSTPVTSTAAVPPLATSEVSERLAASLLQALSISGYVKPGADATVEDRVRRLVRRLRLSTDDADLFQGMVKQILWKLRT
jgi:TrmH family RNA methyltransferase